MDLITDLDGLREFVLGFGAVTCFVNERSEISENRRFEAAVADFATEAVGVGEARLEGNSIIVPTTGVPAPWWWTMGCRPTLS